ncbi:hypothetical protein CDAR_211801 [Caerostris darwini]|uniref:Uncharacterized protein n=1 Tax=Caerostris darwini TaxID=1538125 RepID=A0AAV4PBZ6_9ARAC|nr:hypothetical protein CDAR_211801 [Caerostris darwini]
MKQGSFATCYKKRMRSSVTLRRDVTSTPTRCAYKEMGQVQLRGGGGSVMTFRSSRQKPKWTRMLIFKTSTGCFGIATALRDWNG